MVPPARPGTFSPTSGHALQTSGGNHSPHPSQSGHLSAASPGSGSPTANNSLNKIAVAQVYLLLSTNKGDKDEQLKKLIDVHGMEVFTKYFARLVAGNASLIFPSLSRSGGNSGNHHILVNEVRKISHDTEQARKIAESIETGAEDIFRDFDLSTFMEHFKLDALEKTILALAFKLGPRSDLKTKADAILSTNFPTFVNILSKGDGEHGDLSHAFISLIVDRFIQYHPPNFSPPTKQELRAKVEQRYSSSDSIPPAEVLAALDLMRVLGDKSPNALALFIQRTGSDFTRDEDSCVAYLQSRPSNIAPSEEQVAAALTYTTISQNPQHDPAVLVAGLRHIVPSTFSWQDVVSYFDQRASRISPAQFLRLYTALVPLAQENPETFDIQRLWGGIWENPDTQLSFICALTSLSPPQLDASTIPGLRPTLTLDDYSQAPPAVLERAIQASQHPLVSLDAISAIFNSALHSAHASTNIEAKRLFQEVVVPNLDLFVVSAFSVEKPWSGMAIETFNSLFDNFLFKPVDFADFVFHSLWKKDKAWVMQRLIETHLSQPNQLPLIFDLAVKHHWLNDLVYMVNGFGLDLTAYAHSRNEIDLHEWAKNLAEKRIEIARPLMQFLMIKANLETEQSNSAQDPTQPPRNNVPLRLRTVSTLLSILDEIPKTSVPQSDLIQLQRNCITCYPRLINYGQGFDAIIEANCEEGHTLPQAATHRMEEHFKKMYGNEIEVRTVVDALEHYKRSREPLDQDVFACMIHSLFDEYNHFGNYPLEALATTAVLFGGIISHKLIADLPLHIGLGMILEAVRDHMPNHAMYKFGLQALIQLFPRLREWPAFCRQLLQIEGLQNTEAWRKAEEAVRNYDDDVNRNRGGPANAGHGSMLNAAEALINGNMDDAPEPQASPFKAINVDPLPLSANFEDPDEDMQGKVQFVLNNITENTLQSSLSDLRPMVEDRHHQWFASHLVDERAKMQPNYHKVYLELVDRFGDKVLWSQILRETFISVSRMINSEATMQNSTERTHLKNLGGWLGLLTLARDKPIKHKNIAFKQLLIEAHDTKRLIVVIPFVCKVLLCGEKSSVFKPPNPWLMDIIHFLIELYHNAELKLNLKFEIEVLCKGLNLDHKNIEPSGEILNRVLPVEEPPAMATEPIDTFVEGLSLNGIGAAVTSSLTAHSIAPSIPDVGPNLTIPQVSDMVVSPQRLRDIVHTALTRALRDIIQPVVDRSVAIAAIATQQMIQKDFITEGDETRVRTAAMNMVKQTAGSLALVTSKEPLRANFSNYMRTAADLPQGGTLPEGTIIMCVNANLDLASSIIEKSTEDRAISEIEDMIAPELEARRRHRQQRPNEPYVSPLLNRWAMTIPTPYKLSPSMSGLNPEQMAIYDDFARQLHPTTAPAVASHAASTSDATRSMANEVLQDQYSSLPTPAETPASQALGPQMQPYPHAHAAGMVNGGRQPGANVDGRSIAEKVQKLVAQLQQSANEASEEHFVSLPRSHPVLDIIDALVQTIIRTQQSSEEIAFFAAEQVCQILFAPTQDSTLALESSVHVLQTLRKIAGPTFSQRVTQFFHQQPGTAFLHLSLISALHKTDLIDWSNIDNAMGTALRARKEGSLEFLEKLMDLALLNESPVALYTDFVQSLEAAWAWIEEAPTTPGAEQLKAKLQSQMVGGPPSRPSSGDWENHRWEQMDYVFDEWIHLHNHPNVTEKLLSVFVEQLRARSVLGTRDDLFVFTRFAIDRAVDRFEIVAQHQGTISEAYAGVDALAKLIAVLLKTCLPNDDGAESPRATLYDSLVSLAILILNQHHAKRGEAFNQKVFYRLFSMLLHEVNGIREHISALDHHLMTLRFARRLNDIGPVNYPGFVFAWISLVGHRQLLPSLMQLNNKAGWAPLTRLLKQLLGYLGEQLKAINLSSMAKSLYRSTFKLLTVLHHDFPEYLAVNHIQLSESVPTFCGQILNLLLIANPEPSAKIAGEDRADENQDAPGAADDPAKVLARTGLSPILEQALQTGPTEELIAQITHAINRVDTRQSTYGNVPISTNLAVIDAVMAFIGMHAVNRTELNGGSSHASGVDAQVMATMSMILRELSEEGRYFFLGSIINQLRQPNAHTNFFSQVLLDIFGNDMSDPEEMELREQITRILLERLIGYWPYPWGLVVTIAELAKNEKYMFFDLPFIKSAPELAEQFVKVVRSPPH